MPESPCGSSARSEVLGAFLVGRGSQHWLCYPPRSNAFDARLLANLLLVYLVCTMASSSALTTKQQVGLEMLSEALEGDFGAAFGVLVKVLGNLVANPDDAKYRKLRTSNAKVQAMLATKGVRALLVGSGFVEEPDALNAETADVAAVQAGLDGLKALQVSRAAQEAAQKAASMAERNVQVRAATRPGPHRCPLRRPRLHLLLPPAPLALTLVSAPRP